MNLTQSVFWGILLPILQQHEQGTLSIPERQESVNGDNNLCSQACGCTECEGDWPVGSPLALYTLTIPEGANAEIPSLTAPCSTWEFVFQIAFENNENAPCDQELSAVLDMALRLDPEFRRTCGCPALPGEEAVCTLPSLICGALDLFHAIKNFFLGLWPF